MSNLSNLSKSYKSIINNDKWEKTHGEWDVLSLKSEDMETENEYPTRESFISELAYAMNDHDIDDDQYLNLTQQIISVVQREDYSWGEKWPAEGDEVILVDTIPSREAYDQMKEFADNMSDIRISKELYRAMNKRHPFSAFRYAAERTGVIQQWYQWIDRWENEKAEAWMRENGVDFVDGKIVADGKHTQTWFWDDEEFDTDNDEENY